MEKEEEEENQVGDWEEEKEEESWKVGKKKRKGREKFWSLWWCCWKRRKELEGEAGGGRVGGRWGIEIGGKGGILSAFWILKRGIWRISDITNSFIFPLVLLYQISFLPFFSVLPSFLSSQLYLFSSSPSFFWRCFSPPLARMPIRHNYYFFSFFLDRQTFFLPCHLTLF